ncbi:NAD(P)/FAD-dependent oxidoreductase [Methylotuvimicrobium buryatense]|uniref:FAD-dependent oxidoreductase n=1 Tax=Methylotuvimicrobium buryatense TaxID=95641 RepID=A0A4P9UXA5_METBY|nr:FAD-dependent oxidoreductase [Methylotuvimicrobium buryatense]QCW84456.1 FAD-dependent oxidoreductase [Methylotuvimicrobium buryatense]
MKIAIVGSGISGIYTAHYLDKQHEVTIYEANTYLGGHTDTHNIVLHDRQFAVDTGFIVFNEHNYIHFCRFLNELGVASQPSDMSFSVADAKTGLEYNATTIDKLFCQRRNLFSPRFYRMIADIFRFYREAPALLKSGDDTLTLGEYLQQNRYSEAFIDDHILPMACALWSGPPESLKNFPARYFVAFMNNHRMLKIDDRPLWRTVKGGSSTYVEAFKQRFGGELRLNSPVRSIARDNDGVTIIDESGERRFDQVVIACHGDQTLRLLSDPSPDETEILGAFSFQDNDTVLHTDAALMPRHPKAWASWNALKPAGTQANCTVTYCMNLLQNLDAPEPLLVSLNCTDRIDPSKILMQRHYRHPVYTPESLAAQKRHAEINGLNRTFYAGAYWGWGFHEDGAASAQLAIDKLNAPS